MNSKYKFPCEQEAFLGAKNFLNGMISALCSQKRLHAEHGEVEKFIYKDGFELMRLLFQGHLDKRAENEPQFSSVRQENEEPDYTREDCSRQINSLFGKVEVRRKGYSVKGRDSVFPQDAALNLSLDRYSDGLRRQAALAVSDLSFDKSTQSVLRHTASQVPKRQMENLIRHMSCDFDEFYKSQERMDIPDRSDLLVLSCDGKGVVMRQSDLRAATQKAAKSAKHKKQTRLSKGEKRNCKRMATVASVYGIDPHIRSAQSIMGVAEKTSAAPKPSHKRVWASVEKSSSEVIEDMFAEALRRDPNQKRKWAVLVDGQAIQLTEVQRIMKRLKVKATIVMDFIHVLEYLWKAAYCFTEETSQAAEDWVMERALKVLNGKASQVAAGIRRSSTKRNLTTKERENADKCADYLLKKKAFLQYDKYLKQGLPIATGVIEGACRYLVKDRLDITGARWGLKGAEAVLKIRALVSSDDFENYFTFHKKQERSRNYPFYDKIAYKMAA